jgi:hypothetical protein
LAPAALLCAGSQWRWIRQRCCLRLTHLGALGFLARAAPAGASARAQGYLAIALGLVMAMAMAVSGALYTRWGSFAYLAMAFAAASGGLCALAAARFTFGRVDERAPPTEAR